MLDLASHLSSRSSSFRGSEHLSTQASIQYGTQSHVLYNVPREMPMFAFSVSSLEVQ